MANKNTGENLKEYERKKLDQQKQNEDNNKGCLPDQQNWLKDQENRA
jgi:hypothetical protein